MNYADTTATNTAITTTQGNSAPQMTLKLGNTLYEGYIHFSKTSKETMTDKVMRLIRNELNSADMS